MGRAAPVHWAYPGRCRQARAGRRTTGGTGQLLTQLSGAAGDQGHVSRTALATAVAVMPPYETDHTARPCWSTLLWDGVVSRSGAR